MYSFVLTLHNITRWFVLIFALIAIVRAFTGWLKKKEWQKADDRAGIFYTSFLDLQLLLGLVLYLVLSPITQSAFSSFATAMQDTTTRLFTLEHPLMMGIALVLAHVGRTLSKRAVGAAQKHKQAAIWFTASFLIILMLIPWGRPLLRLFGISF
jgi:hypothetical protein